MADRKEYQALLRDGNLYGLLRNNWRNEGNGVQSLHFKDFLQEYRLETDPAWTYDKIAEAKEKLVFETLRDEPWLRTQWIRLNMAKAAYTMYMGTNFIIVRTSIEQRIIRVYGSLQNQQGLPLSSIRPYGTIKSLSLAFEIIDKCTYAAIHPKATEMEVCAAVADRKYGCEGEEMTNFQERQIFNKRVTACAKYLLRDHTRLQIPTYVYEFVTLAKMLGKLCIMDLCRNSRNMQRFIFAQELHELVLPTDYLENMSLEAIVRHLKSSLLIRIHKNCPACHRLSYPILRPFKHSCLQYNKSLLLAYEHMVKLSSLL